MGDAETRGWGTPCSGTVRTLVRGDGLRLPVRAELVDLTAMLIDETERLGYDVRPGETWGFACRRISGSSTWSNHAWGLAVDLNAPANPYASADWHARNARGPWPHLVSDIPPKVVALWEGCGYRWGGRYLTKPDPMHLEFMGTPQDAAAATERLRARLFPPPAPSTEEELVMRSRIVWYQEAGRPGPLAYRVVEASDGKGGWQATHATYIATTEQRHLLAALGVPEAVGDGSQAKPLPAPLWTAGLAMFGGPLATRGA